MPNVLLLKSAAAVLFLNALLTAEIPFARMEWGSLLREARRVFPRAEFPAGWEIG